MTNGSKQWIRRGGDAPMKRDYTIAGAIVLIVVAFALGSTVQAPDPYVPATSSPRQTPAPYVPAAQTVNDAATPDPTPTTVKPTPQPTRTQSAASRQRKWIESVRACIMHRESRGQYDAVGIWVTVNGKRDRATGAYQFMGSTWRNVTGLPGEAKDYSPKVQDRAFYKLFNNGAGRLHWYLSGGKQCW